MFTGGTIWVLPHGHICLTSETRIQKGEGWKPNLRHWDQPPTYREGPRKATDFHPTPEQTPGLPLSHVAMASDRSLQEKLYLPGIPQVLVGGRVAWSLFHQLSFSGCVTTVWGEVLHVLSGHGGHGPHHRDLLRAAELLPPMRASETR